MNEKKYKRSRLLINPDFQYKMIAFFVIVSILMSLAILIFAWQSYSSFVSTLSAKETELGLYTDMVNEFLEPGAQVFWVPSEYKAQVVFRLVGFTLVLGLLVIFLGVVISHRIAGPLHRLNNCFLSIAGGRNVPHLRFRDRDEFQHLAESFNRCVGTLSNRHKDLVKAEKDLFEKLKETLRQSKDEGSRQKAFELLDTHSNQHHQATDGLSDA